RGGYTLGGEQSGHVILSQHLFTGDGIVTALSVLRVMAESGRSLRDLASEMTTYPQVLVNVRVAERVPVAEVPAIAAVMADVERQLGSEGRLLVRYSGTEPLLRIMIEGRDQQEIDAWAHEIAETARQALGEGRPSGPFSHDLSYPLFAMARLSVNIHKVATVRNSRGGSIPSVVDAARVCLEAEAPGITVHPRADQRHITPTDVRELAEMLAPYRQKVEFNIEGDPRPDLLALVHEVRPHQCTLVPVRPGEITSEAGWPADTPVDTLRGQVTALRDAGVRVSMF